MRPDAQTLRPIVRGALFATGLFCLVMAVLLVATFIQTGMHASIDSPALTRLMEALDRDPTNQPLREEIRALDLLARKAYFTTRWQLQWGGVLLIGAGMVFFALHTVLHLLSPASPVRPGPLSITWWMEQTRTRKAIAGTGGVAFAAALISGFVVDQDLSRTPSRKTAHTAASQEEMKRQWPGFRGPDGNAVAYHTNAPLSWDGASMSGVRWKVEVPRPGNSSPVVWKDRIFLTGGDQEAREVYCLSRKTGRLLWRHRVRDPSRAGQPLPKVDQETGYAAPTVACDGKRVYAIFAGGELVSLDMRGRRRWFRHMGVPANHYGHSSSLIVSDGLLFVQFDHHNGGTLSALESATGATRWEVPRPELSWTSPILVNTGTRRELIVIDNKTVASFDPASGTPLWNHDCMGGEVGPSPAFASGRVFVANEYALAAGIEIHRDSSRIIWTSMENLPSTASPVAADRYVFLACAMGAMTCVDARTGKTLWSQDFDKGFYASPIIVGDRVYALDRKGVMRIFSAADEYRSLGSPALGEAAVATPAFLDGEIIIRGERHLFCIGGSQ